MTDLISGISIQVLIHLLKPETHLLLAHCPSNSCGGWPDSSDTAIGVDGTQILTANTGEAHSWGLEIDF
jgi:hypothetical protein